MTCRIAQNNRNCGLTTTTRHASINNSIPSNTHGHKWNYGNQNSRQLHVTQSNLSHASHG